MLCEEMHEMAISPDVHLQVMMPIPSGLKVAISVLTLVMRECLNPFLLYLSLTELLPFFHRKSMLTSSDLPIVKIVRSDEHWSLNC